MKISIKEILFLILLFLLNGLLSYFLPLIDDEAYYWMWSKQLDFGYFDHPPLVALMIKLGYSIFDNELGVRLLTGFMFIGFLLMWRIILKPKNYAELKIFYLIFLSFVGFQVFGFVTTPDVPLLFFSTLYLLVLQLYIDNSKIKNAVLLAISMALVMYSKYQGILVIVFSLIPLFFIFWKKKNFYLAILFSLLIYAPHLFWQHQNDWVSIEYHFFGRVKNNQFSILKMLEYVGGFFAFGSLVFMLEKGKSVFKKQSHLFHSALQYIVLGSFIFFLTFSFTREVQPQWNIVIYLALAPLIFLNIKTKNTNAILFKLAFAQILLLIVAKIVLLFPVFETPMHKLKNFVLEAEQKTTQIAVFERYQHTSAYQFYTQEKAYCYRVYNHRPSQFDLWKDEENLQNKDFTFFGIEGLSEDSIVDNYGKTERISSHHNFISYPKVEIFVDENSLEYQEGYLSIMGKIHNPYEYDVTLDAENMQLILIGFSPKLHPHFIYSMLEKPITIAANSTEEFYFEKSLELPQNLKQYAIGLRPKSISGKKQSDYFQLNANF